MTTKPTRKLPKGRVMHVAKPAHVNDPAVTLWANAATHFSPVTVLPATSTKQGRRTLKAAKFLGMTEEEQVEIIARELWRQSWRDGMLGTDAESTLLWQQKAPDERACYLARARAVLSLIYGEQNK